MMFLFLFTFSALRPEKIIRIGCGRAHTLAYSGKFYFSSLCICLFVLIFVCFGGGGRRGFVFLVVCFSFTSRFFASISVWVLFMRVFLSVLLSFCVPLFSVCCFYISFFLLVYACWLSFISLSVILFLPFYLIFCQHVALFICLFLTVFSLCVSLFLCLSVVHLSVCMFVCLPACLSIRPSVCPSVHLCLYVRPSVCLSVKKSLSLFCIVTCTFRIRKIVQLRCQWRWAVRPWW